MIVNRSYVRDRGHGIVGRESLFDKGGFER